MMSATNKVELLYDQNNLLIGPHQIIDTPRDGSCLFSALSYTIYGNFCKSNEIRARVVQYVIQHWESYYLLSCDSQGNPYENQKIYHEEMSRHSTFGAISELKAASQIYEFYFQLFNEGRLRQSFGNAMNPVRRLRFSGCSIAGHFDVFVPITTIREVSNQTNTSVTGNEHGNLNVSDLSELEKVKKRGRPKNWKKVKRGRPKTSDKTLQQQQKEASARYRANHPEQCQKSLKRYKTLNRDVDRRAVKKYAEEHPEINRASVKRYSEKNPQINREAVKRYSAGNPSVKCQARKRYSKFKPEEHVQSERKRRELAKLQLKKFNKSNAISRLADNLKDWVEAERIINWTMLNRKLKLDSFVNATEKLKQLAKSSLESFQGLCVSSIQEQFEMLLGSAEHRSSQEPYYLETSYNTYDAKDTAIIIDSVGRAHFQQGTELSDENCGWTCNPIVCKLDQKLLDSIVVVFREIEFQPISKIFKGGHTSLIGKINLIKSGKPHFPRLRTVIRLLYQIHSDCTQIQRIDEGLLNVNLVTLKEMAQNKILGKVLLGDGENTLVEEVIQNEFKVAFNRFLKRAFDVPKNECMSCKKLCSRRNVSQLKLLRSKIETDIWKELCNYYQNNNETPSGYVCKYCLSILRANEMPPTCIINNLFVTTTPTSISVLNDYEKILIQRAKAFQVVQSMNCVSNKHLPYSQRIKKVKGRTFHLPLPLEMTLKTIPAPDQAINPHDELYILVRGMPTKQKIIWEELVDVKKIYSALTYLKNINPLYYDIKLPESKCELLATMKKEIHYFKDGADNDSEESGDGATLNFIKDEKCHAEDKCEDNNDESPMLSKIRSENESIYEQYTIYPLYEKRKNLPLTEMYQMQKINAAPLYNTDPNLDVKCFPDLFADGKFGQAYPRTKQLSVSEYAKARLMSSFAQFRLNQQYLFFLLNDLNIRQINAGIFYKMNCVNVAEKLTAKDYFERLKDDELETNITAVFGKLRNTEQYWKKPRNEVNCMTENYGPATWFITVSPSEWTWTELGDYLREVNGPKFANKSISEMRALDPVSTSRFLNNKFKALIDFITSPDAPLGKVKHYFWRREYQSRGIQHFHLLVWVEDAPIIGKSSNEEIAKFLCKYVSCDIPCKNISPMLNQLVYLNQTHKHNPYCMRKKKTKKGLVSVCRFGFPRIVSDVVVIRDVSESIAGRRTLNPNKRLYDLVRKQDSIMINDYNPALLLAWKGNMDIQFVGEKSSILNYYITKYATKTEKAHFHDIFETINGTRTLQSQLFNIGLRVLSNRECGAFEASDALLQMPLYGTDPSTTIRWLDVNIFRNRRMKSKVELEKLHPDSTDIYHNSFVDDHYAKRPQELENMNLFCFAQWFDIVRLRPRSAKFTYYTIDAKTFYKKRNRPYLINHYHFDPKQEAEKYFHSILLMFKSWRHVADLKAGFQTYTEAFNATKCDLQDGLRYANIREDFYTKLQVAFDQVEQKVNEILQERNTLEEEEEEGPENPLLFEILEAENAMDDFQNINSLSDVASSMTLNVMINSLNKDQERIFSNITSIVGRESGIIRCFISGTGGTGKSHLIKTLQNWMLIKLEKGVAITAPTGIAAHNINGLTIHRLLQLPVEHKKFPKYKPLSDEVLTILRRELKNITMFIIDEVSMVSNVMLCYIHLRLCEIFDTFDQEDGWFGGKHILLFGDLLQLPPVRANPVYEKLSKPEVAKFVGCINLPNLWVELFKYDELTVNMRQKNDNEYVNILNRVRIGAMTEVDHQMLSSRLITLKSNSYNGRQTEIAEYISLLPDDTICLLPTRVMCQELNNAMLQRIKNDEIVIAAIDDIDCPKHLMKRARLSLKLCEDDATMTAGLEEKIIIKVGAKVMLRRNIDVSIGLVHGAVGVVTGVRYDYEDLSRVKKIKIKFCSSGTHEIEPVRTKFEIINKAYVYRQQFPICLAYGVTIHKSQGLTLENAVIDLGSNVFSCGQAYVALSRVSSLTGLHLINLNFNCVKAQASAICEYNRLRNLYRPDLPIIEIIKSKKRSLKDRIWTVSKPYYDVQQGQRPNKRRNKKQ